METISLPGFNVLYGKVFTQTEDEPNRLLLELDILIVRNA